jgi:hypothetical protein
MGLDLALLLRVTDGKTAQYAATRADEPNFIDQARLRFIITQERVII